MISGPPGQPNECAARRQAAASGWRGGHAAAELPGLAMPPTQDAMARIAARQRVSC